MAYRRILGCVLFMLCSFQVTVAQDGEVLMDVGFRAETDGFSFENYGDDLDVVNLTPAEMVRLFGEDVCSSAVDDEGGCDLTPSAEMWMQEVSGEMAGGHCEGMAVLSMLLYTGEIDVTYFGSDATVDLSIEDNEDLQREIALWWATQGTSPTFDDVVTGTPSEIIDALVNGMADNLYTIGIYLPDGDGGHAITPYAVLDMGDGIYHIMVYDNNYPGEERFIEVDVNEETWVYTGSTNPEEEESEYTGDAETQTLDLTPMYSRLQVQNCDFCGDAGTSTDEDYVSVSLNGRGTLLVKDASGKKVGVENGKIVNEIAGAKIKPGKNGFSSYRPPVIYLPADTIFTASITREEGFGKPASSIKIINRGSVTIIGGITPGETEDTLNVDGEKINYASGEGADELVFRQGVSAQSGEDFLYEFSGTSGTLIYSFDPIDGASQFAGDEGASFDVSIEKVDAEGNSTDYHTEDWTLDGDGMGQFNPTAWEDTLEIETVDENGEVIGTESFENTPDDTGEVIGDDTGSDDGTGTDTGDEAGDNTDTDTGDDTGSDDGTGTDDSGTDTGSEGDTGTDDSGTDTGGEETDG